MHHSDNQIVIKYNLVFLTKIIVSIFAYIRKFSYLCIWIKGSSFDYSEPTLQVEPIKIIKIMNTKVNSLNEKQRKLWAIIREALNYEDTDEDFYEFKEEAEGLLADDEEDFYVTYNSMDDFDASDVIDLINA